ncbi:MAG TPA: response regulator [Candidatus Acidoferrum sp.]
MKKKKKGSKPQKQLAELLARVSELEETLRAIRMGEVDAVLVSGPAGEQVFTLQGAEHPYRLLVETIDEGAATLSEDGTVLYSNKSFAAIFKAPLEKFIGAPLQSFVFGEGRAALQRLLDGGKDCSIRGEIRLQDGAARPRTVRLTLSPNHELGLDTICAVATELTELVETNEALRVTEMSLRQLSARLLQLQDEERRRIARDLHDITGQKIAILSMALDRLTRQVDPKKKDVRETLRESRDTVRAIGEEVRTLSYLLHPPLLDECGLASAIRWYAEGFEKRSGIQLEVSIPTGVTRLPIDSETALFRVVQESLTNVHRYSGSTSAEIRMSVVSDQVQLEVIDHGKGIEAGAEPLPLEGSNSLGVGIPGMRERLHQLGGRLEVDFGKEGTRVVAILPVRPPRRVQADGDRLEADFADAAAIEMNGDAERDARRRVLIADDHEVMRRGLRGLIESQDEWAICGEAVEGIEAVQKWRDLRPDLVILDVNMPGMTGIEAAQQILRENKYAKVLFFTVHDTDQMVREMVTIGAQGYVSKSRAGQDLVDAVRNVLGGKTFFPNSAVTVARTA